jgi:hypothetical protein
MSQAKSQVKSGAKVLHVLMPGFCGPLFNPGQLQQHEQAVMVLRSWLDRLARARVRNVRLNYLVNLYRLLGFSLERFSGVPTAAFRLCAASDAGQYANVMHADPVHLQADMDHAIMTSPQELDLFEHHADELIEKLNSTFADDDISFFRLNSGEWFVTASGSIDLQTTPLSESVGRNVNHLLPSGPHSQYWKRLLTEVQMVLFDHEVNDEREARGLTKINSLWFHGNGVLPDRGEHDARCVFSDDPVVLGMAAYADVEAYHCDRTQAETARSCFEQMQAKISQGPAGDYIFKVSSLQDLVNYTDVTPWLTQVNVLIENWLEPLLAFAHQQGVTFRFYPENDRVYQIGKYDGLRVWKSARLYDFVQSYSAGQYD